MLGTAAIRISLLGATLAFTFPAFADAELDDLVKAHVMPRFDQQARVFIRNSGARFVSSAWNGDSRTLIAVGEVDRPDPPEAVNVALNGSTPRLTRELKREHVAQICRNPMVGLITRFLERYDVTMALVYAGRHGRTDTDVIEISHADLQTCA